MKFLKKLNWSSALLVFVFCGLGAIGRNQDPDLATSILVWLIFGIPISLLVAIIARDK